MAAWDTHCTRLNSDLSINLVPDGRGDPASGKKKADVAKHPKVLNHVGSPINEPLGRTRLPFIKSIR